MEALMEETLIKNINPRYLVGIIIISTLRMRKQRITGVKSLGLVAQPGPEPGAGCWLPEGFGPCLLS